MLCQDAKGMPLEGMVVLMQHILYLTLFFDMQSAATALFSAPKSTTELSRYCSSAAGSVTYTGAHMTSYDFCRQQRITRLPQQPVHSAADPAIVALATRSQAPPTGLRLAVSGGRLWRCV